MKRSDVFVSYRRVNKVFARELVQALEASELNIWVDWDDIPPGSEDFTTDIREGIAGADVFVPVLSPSYLESEYCMGELQIAVDQSKRILPVVHEKFDDTQIPQAISHVNWVYFTPHVGETNEFERAFPLLLQAIQTDQQHVAMHTRILLRAQEWDTNERDSSFLLSGVELQEAENWQLSASGKDPVPTTLHSEYILASEEAAARRIRRILGGVSVAAVISLVLAAVAFYFLIQSELLNTEVESLLWSNNAQQVINEGDNLLALRLAEESTTVTNQLVSWLPFVDPEPPLLSQQILATAGYLPGARQQISLHDSSVWSLDALPSMAENWLTVSGDANGDVLLWDVRTNEEITLGTHSASVWSVNFTADGTQVISSSADGILKLWDITSGDEVWSQAVDTPIWSTAVSPNGAYLVTGDISGTVSLWSLPSGELLDTIRAHQGAVWALAYANNGELFASSGAMGLIHLHSVVDNRITIERSESTGEGGTDLSGVWSLAFNADDTLLVTGLQNRNIMVWRMADFEDIAVLEGHRDRILALTFTRDAGTGRDTLASGSGDGEVILWNVANERIERRLGGHSDSVWGIVFNSDGNQMVSASADDTLILWDRYSGAQQAAYTWHNDWVESLAVDPKRTAGQSYLATGSRSGQIYLYSEQRGEAARIDNVAGEVTGLAFSPVDDVLAATSTDAILRLWQNLEFGQLNAPARELTAHRDRIWSVAYDDTGDFLVTGSADRTAILWDLRDFDINSVQSRPTPIILGNDETITDGHIDDVYVADFVPNDDPDTITIVTGGADNQLLLWDVYLGAEDIAAEIEIYPLDYSEISRLDGDILALAVSEDGRYVLTGSANSELLLWDLQTDIVTELAPRHTGDITAIDFIPLERTEGDYMAVSVDNDGLILVWDFIDLNEPLRNYETTDGILSVVYDPVRDVIFTGDNGSRVLEWRADTLTELLGWIDENRRPGELSPEECERYSPNPTTCDGTDMATPAPATQATPTPNANTNEDTDG